jgi:hypothetical protein
MLAWLDGRNASAFKNLAWSNGTMSFSVAKAAGANGLTVMLPTASSAGLLNSLTLDGTAVSYRVESIKGLEYAFFTAAAGTYSATYAPVAAAPAMAALAVAATDANVPTVSFTTDRATTTDLQWGDTATALTRTTRDGGAKRKHSLEISGAKPGTTIFYRLRSRDPQGKEISWPTADKPAATFAVPARDPGAPAIGGLAVETLPDRTTSLAWDTDQRAHASVLFGSSATDLARVRLGSGRTRSHVVVLSDLAPRRTYYYRVRVRNALGELASSAVGSFQAPDWGLADSRLTQWRIGDATGMAYGEAGDGELQLAAGGTSGTYVSRLLDAQQMVTWRKAAWNAAVPAGTSLKVSVRTGSTSKPDGSWTDWTAVPSNGASLASLVAGSRYLQYRVEMSADGTASPVLRSIGFATSGTPPKGDTETGG